MIDYERVINSANEIGFVRTADERRFDTQYKGTPGVFPQQLRRYWLGKGLSRWATTPTPYRSLVKALRSEGVPGRMINGLAARLYKQHFGIWPGKRGKKWVDITLEYKAGPRYVRTAEGALRYGKPIGSLITREDRRKARISHSRVGRFGPAAGGQKIDLKDPDHARYKPKSKTRAQTKKLERIRKIEKDDIAGIWSWSEDGTLRKRPTIQVAESTNKESPWEVEIWDDSSTYFGPRYIHGAKTAEEAMEAAAQMYLARRKRLSQEGDTYDYEDQWPRNKRPREHENMLDAWEGIRGWDWVGEDDPEVAEEDIRGRWGLVDQEAKDLGYELSRYGGRNARGYEMDVTVAETVNAIMRAHEERYPGMTQLFDRVQLDDSTMGIAFNYLRSVPVYVHGPDGERSTVVQSRSYSQMGMSSAYFSNAIEVNGMDPEDRMKAIMQRQGLEDDKIGWWATDMNEIQEKYGVNEMQAFTIAVMTHEIGHTVGFILQNRFQQDGGEEYNIRPDPEKTVPGYFRDDFLDLLAEYGIMTTDVADGNNAYFEDAFFNTSNRGQSAALDQFAMYIDREALAEHVSIYGSTSTAELFAETWASYQLSENPTEFVSAMGALMEDALIMHLEEGAEDRRTQHTITAR